MTGTEMIEGYRATTARLTGLASKTSFLLVRGPVLSSWFVLLAALYAALITMPGSPPHIGAGFDESWMFGLNLAHANHLVAGRDIIFTYGPLGYLISPEPISGAPVAAFAYHVGLYLIWAAALFRIAVAVRPKTVAFWMIAILALGVVLDLLGRENSMEITLIAVALIPMAQHTRWRYAELGIVAFLAALAAMGKLNAGIAGLVLFLIVLAVVIYRDWPLSASVRRQALAALISLPIWIVFLYFLSTGELRHLWAYLRTGWETIAGYTEGMGAPGPLWEAALDFAILGCIFIGVPLLAVNLRPLWGGLIPAALAGYFELKHAMVRQDQAHAMSFYIRFSVALLFLFVCAKARHDRRLIILFQVFAVVMGYAITVMTYPTFRNDIAARLRMRAAYTSIQNFAHWPSTWRETGTANATARSYSRIGGLSSKGSSVAERFDHIVGQSTVASIPWNIQRIDAHHWKWHPLPVLQLHNAYTPVLDQINAAHIESGSAADFALVDFSDIDSRHPFFAEPLSWRAVLDRYDVETKADDAILMRRRQTARFSSPVPLGSQVTGWDQDVVVPETDGFLLLSPHITKSFSGEVMSLFLRSCPVFIDTRLSSGKTSRWRTISSSMLAGILIQPFPKNGDELYSLFPLEPLHLPTERVVSLSFHTDEPSQYGVHIPLQWSRLPAKASALPAAAP